MNAYDAGHASSAHQTERTRRTYRYLLDAFPKLGRIPSRKEMERDLSLDPEVLSGILRALENDGLIRLEPGSAQIADTYPFSAVPTPHTVTFDSGVEVYCMCAIDCFYVPFLARPDLTVRSQCHICGTEILIRIDGQRVASLNPDTVTLWDSDASYDCPKTNFFCTPAHLQEWIQNHPKEPGRACTVEHALTRGREAVERIRTVAGI